MTIATSASVAVGRDGFARVHSFDQTTSHAAPCSRSISNLRDLPPDNTHDQDNIAAAERTDNRVIGHSPRVNSTQRGWTGWSRFDDDGGTR
ncbi:MAG TPA: hypothetical protein VK607_05775, partial [Kofleriaceae bacterium]|nr:hypothetical protein [Kofleriaceae bacterium]